MEIRQIAFSKVPIHFKICFEVVENLHRVWRPKIRKYRGKSHVPRQNMQECDPVTVLKIQIGHAQQKPVGEIVVVDVEDLAIKHRQERA
ncbi:hypothetical protein LX32DRAFT_646047 [Colletotrichum zoysiae]|uniref:Uncharacterized protein n=1 Tax=Colletotrichum zoysiae TaxID=1216348 RepID=A0AAD9LTZ1_9PEZI|nr:hypothetical protein LX32DRAFT_646047 [Colletotrichum zoysiae]